MNTEKHENNRYLQARKVLVNHLREKGIRDEQVLNAVLEVPRHLFIAPPMRYRAYEDTPLPIENDQTISQPYIVAQMTSILCQGKRLKCVLEIGTGSGYQAAILSRVADIVYTVERIESLARQAEQRFQALGLNNIRVRYADGYLGWPEFAPYPAIIVTAAPEQVPKSLLEQLEEGGRMVIPVGEFDMQSLMLIRRRHDRFEETLLEGVRFVPLLPGIR